MEVEGREIDRADVLDVTQVVRKLGIPLTRFNWMIRKYMFPQPDLVYKKRRYWFKSTFAYYLEQEEKNKDKGIFYLHGKP